MNALAEILSVSFKTKCGKAFCLSTFYRFGTLGIDNFNEFHKHVTALVAAKKAAKHILIGDFNFPEICWPDPMTFCELHRKFINFLSGDLGHSQLINEPTHKSGNSSDLLFTNIPSLIYNLKVLSWNEFCLSDHYAISFEIRIDLKYKKVPKRKTFNFNKGDFIGLNNDLLGVDWDSLFSSNDPYIAWDTFKSTLIELCDHRIPKKTIRSQFQPPWYDTECDRIRRKKEKFRLKAKKTNAPADFEKFRSMRKLFKKTVNNKMRINFIDDSDHAQISKRFWTHVKSKSRST